MLTKSSNLMGVREKSLLFLRLSREQRPRPETGDLVDGESYEMFKPLCLTKIIIELFVFNLTM